MRTTVLACAAALCGVLGCDDDCPRLGYDPVSYDDTLDQWAGPEREDGTRAACASVVEGVCADGKGFLAHGVVGISFTSEVRYFDAAGEFVGGAFAGDLVINGCAGYAGPSRRAVRCNEPEGAPLCGDAVVGELSLPFAD